MGKQREMPANGQVSCRGDRGVAAGAPVVLNITDLPHAASYRALPHSRSRWPSWWSASGDKPAQPAAAWRRAQALIARHEKLFGTWCGSVDRRRAAAFAMRCGGILMSALEHVYGALDSEDTTLEPAGSAGVTA
jgi:hypothetical protein